MTKPVSEQAIAKVVEPLLADDHLRAVSVAIVTPEGWYSWHAGAEGHETPNDESRYQIGSVTKVFTALLLADMAMSGEVRIDASLSEYFVDAPESVTLRELAAHTSGLPRMPATFEVTSNSDPYAGQDVDSLAAHLSGIVLGPKTYAYSNLGPALLGQALARAAGSTYEELVHLRLLEPMGLDDTDFSNDSEGMMPGYDRLGREVVPWNIYGWSPAGALVSDVVDMAKFVRKNLTSEAGTPLRLTHEKVAERDNGRMGLAWHIGFGDLPELRWHNGQTGGFHCFVGFEPNAEVGIVVLSNTASLLVDRVARNLIEAAVERREPELVEDLPLRLTESEMERMVGTYQLVPGVVVQVRRAGSGIVVQIAGQSPIPTVPLSSSELSFPGAPVKLVFELPEEGGRAASMTLVQQGQTTRAERVE
jgi:CubicO group peptidase (beta-lactamase class C family)